MTPRQFAARKKGLRREAELMRIQAFLICSYSGNMKRGTTPRRFWPLPWDNENAPKFEPQDPEKLAAFKERARKIFEQKRIARGGNNSGT